VSPARVRPPLAPDESDPRGFPAGAGTSDPGTPTGPRSELRTRIRARRRLRVISLAALSVVVLALLPLFFSIRAINHDPVYASIDALDVPGWAAQKVQDRSSGSRWCFLDCPLRERTAQSQRDFAPTGKVYAAALSRAGWVPWKVAGCPDQPIDPKDGVYSCWRRDEFTLDLWVRLPDCAVDQVALSDPAVLPSSGIPPTPAGKCTGSTVSIKVQNAISDTRGQPDGEKPGLVGETPDPVLTDDPLLPTPSPS
jgi:integrin beta 3